MPVRTFFSCFRHPIFCKLTVTSVLFNVYYMDNGLTSKNSWGWGFLLVVIFLPSMCVCGDISMNVCVSEGEGVGPDEATESAVDDSRPQNGKLRNLKNVTPVMKLLNPFPDQHLHLFCICLSGNVEKTSTKVIQF